jgi:amino acid transporter
MVFIGFFLLRFIEIHKILFDKRINFSRKLAKIPGLGMLSLSVLVVLLIWSFYQLNGTLFWQLPIIAIIIFIGSKWLQKKFPNLKFEEEKFIEIFAN